MEKVRIGIVGLGRLGMRHAENLAFRVRGARLEAACALEPDRVAHVRATGACREGTRGSRTCWRTRELDAVFIASSSGEHCRQIEQALDAGFHVFCEKPLGISLEECMRRRTPWRVIPTGSSCWASCAATMPPIAAQRS